MVFLFDGARVRSHLFTFDIYKRVSGLQHHHFYTMDMDDLHESFEGAYDRNLLENELPMVEADNIDDDLGIDQTIKLKKTFTRAKIEDDRLLNRPNGIPYIIKNHQKVSRIMKRNDKFLAKNLSKDPKMSSSRKKVLKYENAYKNLESVLEFYQLWCHGLFPKAKFKDCVHLVRAFGAKPGPLKIYRQGLIKTALDNYKREHGIIVESSDPVPKNSDIYVDNDQENSNEEELYGNPTNNDLSDHEFDFMNGGLFVRDEDEEPVLPAAKVSVDKAPELEDSFSDELEQALHKDSEQDIPEQFPDLDDIEESYDAELEVMRDWEN